MQEYTHKCVKCQVPYKDTDPDPYYCEPCNEQRKIIAQEVDRKLAGTVDTNVKSDLQIFDELRKTKGIRGFVNKNDLGIKWD